MLNFLTLNWIEGNGKAARTKTSKTISTIKLKSEEDKCTDGSSKYDKVRGHLKAKHHSLPVNLEKKLKTSKQNSSRIKYLLFYQIQLCFTKFQSLIEGGKLVDKSNLRVV